MAVNIRLEKLMFGMVLAQNVKDRNGRVLLTAGQAINEKNLKMLKAWGITDVLVNVQGEKPEAVSSSVKEEPLKVGKAEQEMRDLFRHADMRHPAVRELFNLCLARKKASSGGSGDAK